MPTDLISGMLSLLGVTGDGNLVIDCHIAPDVRLLEVPGFKPAAVNVFKCEGFCQSQSTVPAKRPFRFRGNRKVFKTGRIMNDCNCCTATALEIIPVPLEPQRNNTRIDIPEESLKMVHVIRNHQGKTSYEAEVSIINGCRCSKCSVAGKALRLPPVSSHSTPPSRTTRPFAPPTSFEDIIRQQQQESQQKEKDSWQEWALCYSNYSVSMSSLCNFWNLRYDNFHSIQFKNTSTTYGHNYVMTEAIDFGLSSSKSIV